MPEVGAAAGGPPARPCSGETSGGEGGASQEGAMGGPWRAGAGLLPALGTRTGLHRSPRGCPRRTVGGRDAAASSAAGSTSPGRVAARCPRRRHPPLGAAAVSSTMSVTLGEVTFTPPSSFLAHQTLPFFHALTPLAAFSHRAGDLAPRWVRSVCATHTHCPPTSSPLVVRDALSTRILPDLSSAAAAPKQPKQPCNHPRWSGAPNLTAGVPEAPSIGLFLHDSYMPAHGTYPTR